MNEKFQIIDDSELLRVMVDDNKKAPGIFQPTNYWSVYENRFLPELEKNGLNDFRRRRNSVLSSFGGTSLGRIPPLDKWYMNWLPFGSKRKIAEIIAELAFYGKNRQKIIRTYVQQASLYGQARGAKPLETCDTTLFGNPAESAEIDKHHFSTGLINCYLRYAWAARYIDFSRVNTYVELGPGLGTQALCLKQLYPRMTILLFDLPAQLYVCESYMKRALPSSTISYRELRSVQSMSDIRDGCVHFFGAHQIPFILSGDFDLFWNAASFQEMEPEVVENYLEIIKGKASNVYLMQTLYGKQIARKPDEVGVRNQTTFVHYFENLRAQYSLMALDRVKNFEHECLDKENYAQAIWKKRETN